MCSGVAETGFLSHSWPGALPNKPAAKRKVKSARRILCEMKRDGPRLEIRLDIERNAISAPSGSGAPVEFQRFAEDFHVLESLPILGSREKE
jgi:hypothetical protein